MVQYFISVNSLSFPWITRFTIKPALWRSIKICRYSRIIRILIFVTARSRACTAGTAKSFWFLLQVRFIRARKRTFLGIGFVSFCRYNLLCLGEDVSWNSLRIIIYHCERCRLIIIYHTCMIFPLDNSFSKLYSFWMTTYCKLRNMAVKLRNSHSKRNLCLSMKLSSWICRPLRFYTKWPFLKLS